MPKEIQYRRMDRGAPMRRMLFILCLGLLAVAGAAWAGGEIDLSGTWSYCILESEMDYPPGPDATWDTVELPNRDLFTLIAKKRSIARGFVLYRKTFTLEAVPAEPQAFQAGEIMNADRVFVNGMEAGKTGRFPPAFRSGWSQFRHYPLPRDLLQPGVNTVEILDYFDAELWVLSPLRITGERPGSRDYMLRNFLQVELIHALCLLLLCFSLFFLMIYVKRKKEVAYLYYAVATISLADMTILQFVENLYSYIPLSSNALLRICLMGLVMFPPFLALFFRSYLGLPVTGRRIAAYLALPAIVAIATTLLPDRDQIIRVRDAYLLLVPLYIADIVYISVRQIVAGNRKGLMLFVSLIPMFAFGAFDILVFVLHSFEGSVPLYPLGAPFMVVLIGLQLVNRFIYNLNTSEQLNVLLQEKMEEGKRLASLENELSIARRIQMATIPWSLPEVTGFDVGVKYIPATDVSGDFYNFHSAEKDRLGILVADVSGHGVSAALIASMVKILFNALAPVYSWPDEFIRGLNSYLYNKMEENFLTAGYCYIDKTGKKALFARAGHEPLVHISHRNGEPFLQEYMPRGTAIGFHPEVDIALFRFDIHRGDRIILYTDGLTEAFGPGGTLFGHDRLNALFLRSARLSIDGAIELTLSTLREWIFPAEFHDDFTLIMVDID